MACLLGHAPGTIYVNDQACTGAVGRNNRRFHCPRGKRCEARPLTRHLPAIIIAWIIASFLLSGITTPRPIFQPAPAVPAPVIAQFLQFTGPSSRVNTENSATERRVTVDYGRTNFSAPSNFSNGRFERSPESY